MIANKLVIAAAFILFDNHPFVKDIQNAAEILKAEKATILHIKNTSATEGSEALSVVTPEKQIL